MPVSCSIAGSTGCVRLECPIRMPTTSDAASAPAATSAARTTPQGALVPLAEQDRSRWDAAAVAEGVALVTAALRRGRVGELRPPMPDGALPQAAGAVDVLVAVDVPEPGALTARPDERLGGLSDDGVRMDHVCPVERGQVSHTAFLTVLSVVYSSIVCGPCSKP